MTVFSFQKGAYCLALLTLPFLAYAKDSAISEYTQILQDLDKTQSSLQKSERESEACNDKKPTYCSMDLLCSQLAIEEGGYFIYRNQDGFQIPNFQLLVLLNDASQCLRDPPPITLKDPFVFPKQLTDPEAAGSYRNLQRNRERFETQVDRAQLIFDDVKSTLLKILESRRTSQNSEQINLLQKRVRTVKLDAPRPSANNAFLGKSGCEMPNAFYNRLNHSMILCPQELNMPEATLFATISHELGHSIDPCTLTIPFGQSQSGIYFQNLHDPLKYEANPVGSVLPALPFEKNPLDSAVSCLRGQDSVAAKHPDQKTILQELNKKIAQMPYNTQLPEKRDLIENQYEVLQYCGYLTGSQVTESFADWIAAESLAQKLSTISEPARARKYALESQLLYLSTGCPNLQRTNRAKLSTLSAQLNSRCDSFREKQIQLLYPGHNEHDDHPSIKDRLNRIALAHPALRRALGCQGDLGLNGKKCP